MLLVRPFGMELEPVYWHGFVAYCFNVRGGGEGEPEEAFWNLIQGLTVRLGHGNDGGESFEDLIMVKDSDRFEPSDHMAHV